MSKKILDKYKTKKPRKHFVYEAFFSGEGGIRTPGTR